MNTHGVVTRGKNPRKIGRHPVIFIEWGGHGQYGSEEDILEKDFFDSSATLIFIPKGISIPEIEFPENTSSYELIPIYETFWNRRDSIGEGKTFDKLFDFQFGDMTFQLPANFDGNISGEGVFKEDAASAPWYAHSEKGEEGTWFLDPLKIIQDRLGIKIEDDEYIWNPYLADLLKTAGRKQ